MLYNVRKIFPIAQTSDRPKVLVVGLLMIIAAFAQTAGVASIMPFLAVLADPEVIHRNQWLSQAYAYDVGGSVRTPSLPACAQHYRFLCHVRRRDCAASDCLVGDRAIFLALAVPPVAPTDGGLSRSSLHYAEARNSGDLSKTVLQEAWQAINGALMPFYGSLSFGFLALSLIILLVVAQPLLAVSLAAGLGRLTERPIRSSASGWRAWGGAEWSPTAERFTATAEAFTGLKEIRLLGRDAISSGSATGIRRGAWRAQANTAIITQTCPVIRRGSSVRRRWSSYCI
ncbi:MAG: hypothetical protein MZV65_22210 [Chromatiales bacterium]|nr:hypothetical protein [Chromatiales bacterium]